MDENLIQGKEETFLLLEVKGGLLSTKEDFRKCSGIKRYVFSNEKEDKMKKLIIAGLMSLVIISCSSPQTIVLNDGSVIKTRDEPKFNKRTKYYEYEDVEGNRGSVNSKSVKLIQPEGAEIPEGVIAEEKKEEVAAEAVEVPVGEPATAPEEEVFTEAEKE